MTEEAMNIALYHFHILFDLVDLTSKPIFHVFDLTSKLILQVFELTSYGIGIANNPERC